MYYKKNMRIACNQSTVCVKRNAHLIPNFFVASLGEGDQKCEFMVPLSQGARKKIEIKCEFLLTQTVD